MEYWSILLGAGVVSRVACEALRARRRQAKTPRLGTILFNFPRSIGELFLQ
jgi:hypothetical protein